MNENFEKIQKRLLVEALIKSAVLGVGTGLVCVGAVLLALKLSEIYINPAFFVLIGVGAAAVTCGASFWITCPNDKKTAKRLDAEYGLNEKVQTMVEFAGRESEMLSVQREDAERTLASLPPVKPKLSKLWQCCVVAVLGVALFITSVVVPQKQTEPVGGDTEVPFTFTERQKEALGQLIEDVKTTRLEDERKTVAVDSLGALYAALESAGTRELMKSAVTTTVAVIDAVLYTQNSFDDIAFSLGKSQSLKGLGAAVTDGVTFYKGSAMPYVSISQVRDADKVLEETVSTNIAGGFDEYRKVFAITVADGLGEALTVGGNEITAAIAGVTVNPSDALRSAFERFSASLSEIAANADGGYSDGALQDSVSAAFSAVKGDVTEALMPQAYGCIVDEFIRRQLVQIFGLETGDLPPLVSGVQEIDDNKNDDDDENNPGGAGKGDFVVGSDATVYHPDTGDIVKYGEYINEYYAAVLEQLKSGAVPDSLKDYIEQYFATLYTGLEKPEEGEDKQ